MITHIVFFKLADSSPDMVAATRDRLLAMREKIQAIRHLEVGADVIRSERSYDLALLARFDSLADLRTYQDHPVHAGDVVPYIKSVCSSVVAVDYES
ncbi:MAG TPA: Dabb family protein [Geobacteraceae bacterium]|nr:Dabb family protein [Geobacteraceae bacterium]